MLGSLMDIAVVLGIGGLLLAEKMVIEAKSLVNLDLFEEEIENERRERRSDKPQ